MFHGRRNVGPNRRQPQITQTKTYVADTEENLTPGEWDFACDSYGKVQHSKKACIFTVVKKPSGDQIVTVAGRIGNWKDARVLAAAKDLYMALKYINHVTEGGYCICPLNDGNAPSDKHSTACKDARLAIARVDDGK